MADISTWSLTPGDNNQSPPNGWPEFMAASDVNNVARQDRASARGAFEALPYFNYGHVPTRQTNTTFTIPTDLTSLYVANTQLQLEDTTTLYGTVVSSSYSAPNTTVTVELVSGNLSASLSIVRISKISPTNYAVPSTYGRKSADIASASTTSLVTAGDYVDVTGTTTITALGTVQAGTVRTVRFTGALTLTHNATSLILPGGANITTAAGDVGHFRSLGSGNWRCVAYTRTDGSYVAQRKSADIASASTTDLSTATGEFVDVTGTTTITALGTVAAGRKFVLRFNGALTFTHNATSLILPGAANITTASGDSAEVVSLGSGNWICVRYTRANGSQIAPFIDSNPIVAGSSDATKLLRFEVDGLTTATTRVWTAPDYNLNFTHGAFYAFNSVASALSNNTATLVALGSESFDTNGWFDTSASRYTPLVAGKYYIGGAVKFSTCNAACKIASFIYKNGSVVTRAESRTPGANVECTPFVSAVVDMNGSTDYIELYGLQDGGASENNDTGSSNTYLFGFHIPS